MICTTFPQLLLENMHAQFVLVEFRRVFLRPLCFKIMERFDRCMDSGGLLAARFVDDDAPQASALSKLLIVPPHLNSMSIVENRCAGNEGGHRDHRGVDTK